MPTAVLERIGGLFKRRDPFEKSNAAFGRGNPPEVERVKAAIRKHGLVLIRDSVKSPREFVDFTDQIGSDFGVHHKFKAGGRLPALKDDPTVCTVETGNTALPWHREKAYLPNPPELIFFWCMRSVPKCGMTGLCDGEAVYDALPTKAQAYFNDFRLEFGHEWSRETCLEYLAVDTVEEAEAVLKRESRQLQPGDELEFNFGKDQSFLRYRCPAIQYSKWSARPAFANYMLAQKPAHIDTGMLKTAKRITKRLGFFHPWQTGDLIIVDNARFLHCRTDFKAYQSEDRVVLFRMSCAGF